MLSALLALLAATASAAPAEPPKSCVSASCHAAILKKPLVHAAVTEENCQDCHRPVRDAMPFVSGAKHKFEKIKVPQVCVDCHEAPKAKHVHSPVADGDCMTCHAPHASENPKLLNKSYAAGWYGEPASKAYALCFDCHDESVLREKETTEATAFRNGKKNLHVEHVLAQPRGRSCSACHDAHAAEGPKLIAPTVPFFGFQVPINFKPTGTGGSCLPACHELKAYERGEKEKK
jgi:predicted CXXCH cytochrome family protein